jgi:glutamate racemase
MWVPLIENNEYRSDGADYFVKQHIDNLLAADPAIDTILLGCTHYPLLLDKIRQFANGVNVVEQGKIVAESLADYLHRHPLMEMQCSKGGSREFYSTGDTGDFDAHAGEFFGEPIKSSHLQL